MLGKTKKIHFVGIGGAGMSGIAEFLHNQGFEITGSDMNITETTRHLHNKGIIVIKGHSPDVITGADVVVKSSAVNDTNVEIRAAKDKRIPVIRRAEMLAELMRMSYGIAIAGTHGKTTTTSMVGLVLMKAELQPTVIVGGKVINFGSNNVLGCGDQIVVEADEFDRSFLTLSPIIAGITNIEADHLDCYKNLEEIKDAFIEYANKVPFFGCITACTEDKGVRSILPFLKKRVVTYGIKEECDLRAVNITHTMTDNHHPQICFDVMYAGNLLGKINLQQYGEHNVLNALMAVAIALELDVPFETIASALKSFEGVFRRCEYKGSAGSNLFYDDYAHHPTEIIATLKGLKKSSSRRIVALFQPHLYSRTREFATDFGHSLTHCDLLIVTPIFPAREKPIIGVTGKMISDAATQAGHKSVHYIDNNESIVEDTIDLIKEDDIVITIGAGDIYEYGEKIMEILRLIS